MHESTRRTFLQQTVLATAGAIAAPLVASGQTPEPDGVPAPHQHGKPAKLRAVTLRSVQSGAWSQAATWGGRLPRPDDVVAVSSGHTVRHDAEDTLVAGLRIEARGLLAFDPKQSTTLASAGNVIVDGTLRMQPATAEQQHTLRFAEVDEQKFIGGGMDPLDTDVGLWVVGAGKLELLGAAKTSWTNLAGSASKGEAKIAIQKADGWRVGDVVIVVPTETPAENTSNWDDAEQRPTDTFAAKFEQRTITAVDGLAVTLDRPLDHDHSAVATDAGREWTGEVANLTRSVRIEGTTAGRAHIFIRSSKPQSVQYVEGQHLGPRNMQPGQRRPLLVLGRYALHFHHCFDGSRGSIVEGCALHTIGNRVYVPHMSHGITMRDNVAFDSLEAAFWWDFQEVTHDTVWERNLVALVMPNGIDSSSLGMTLGQGDGNVARNNVVVYGHHGDPHGHGGYVWDADNEGVWVFENNRSHSNRTGLFVWQNTSLNHTIVNHESYNDYLAVFHGAYVNSYTYTGGYVYGGIVRVKASSGNASGVRFEKMTFDGANRAPFCVDVYPSPVPSQLDANAFRQCTFRDAPIGVQIDTFPIGKENVRKLVDLIECEFANIERPTSFTEQATRDSTFRIQPIAGKCSRIEAAAGVTEIVPFAPRHYGDGVGLTARYFSGVSFDKHVAERTDSMVMFQQWSYDKATSPTEVHHRIRGDDFSIRWTGFVEPQFSEPHTFQLQGGSGMRLWIDDRLVIDAWQERDSNDSTESSSPLALEQGRKYALKLEAFNEQGARGCQLLWRCPSLGRMVHVPQSQLYPEA